MKKSSNSVILYIKILGLLFIVGFLIPNIIAFALNNLILRPEIQPPDNYLFVMGHLKERESLYEIFLEILEEVIEF